MREKKKKKEEDYHFFDYYFDKRDGQNKLHQAPNEWLTWCSSLLAFLCVCLSEKEAKWRPRKSLLSRKTSWRRVAFLCWQSSLGFPLGFLWGGQSAAEALHFLPSLPRTVFGCCFVLSLVSTVFHAPELPHGKDSLSKAECRAERTLGRRQSPAHTLHSVASLRP